MPRSDVEALVCGVCRSRWRRVAPPHCARCGGTLPPDGPCGFCADWPEALARVWAAVWLDEGARQAMHRLKYGGWWRVSEAVAAGMQPVPLLQGPSVLVPIPLGRRRLRTRGYNQAERLAAALARLGGHEVRTDLLVRRRDTGTQKPGPSVSVLSGKDITVPKLIKTVPPKYPERVRARGIEGTVIVEAVTNADGRVISTKVLKGVAALNRFATDAVKKWVYEPLVLDGRRRPIVFTVTMNFSLSGRSEKTDIEEPKLLRQVTPVYPEEAVRAGIEGPGGLGVTIGDHGLISEVKVLESVPGLDQAAIDAVKEWQYTGAWIGGEPVHYTTTVTIKFSLNAPKKRP